MVYHAFMLNPRTFLADCIRHGKMGLWAAGMPWQAVASAIDNTTFKYSPDKACRDNFERLSRRSWDNLDEPPYIPLKCPHCSSPIRAPWTTIDSASAWEGQSAGEVGRGFADRGFRLLCSCGVEMNHQLLRTRKFVGDMRALFSNHVPMPGTFLTVFGIPDVASKDAPGGGVFPMTFPNRLLKAGAAKKIARVCSTRKFYKASMNDVLVQIKAATDDKEILRKAMLLRSTDASLFKRERLAVRRMMSSYWDNRYVSLISEGGEAK